VNFLNMTQRQKYVFLFVVNMFSPLVILFVDITEATALEYVATDIFKNVSTNFIGLFFFSVLLSRLSSNPSTIL